MDQVVLFHTATLNDLNPECMRHKLLEYYLNPLSRGQVEGVDLNRLRELSRTSDRRPGTQPPPFGSWFEIDVCLDIAEHGFRIIPQYNVAEYRIDLVVEGPKSQLAIECDGDEWHGIEQYERDIARQRILERCGWRFWRIRGHEYYRDTVGAMEPLWRSLFAMGITPASISGFENEVSSEDNEYEQEESPEYDSMISESEQKTTIEAKPSSSPHPHERGRKSRRERQDDDSGRPAQYIHAPSRREPLTCPVCGKEFRTPKGKSWHLANIHQIDDDNTGREPALSTRPRSPHDDGNASHTKGTRAATTSRPPEGEPRQKPAPKQRSDSPKLEQSDVY